MKILVIDNYDSFTWNLAQILHQSGLCDFEVVKNDAVPVFYAGNFDGILLSPGPGLPTNAGICFSLIREFAPAKNIMGICLGFQAMAEVYGGSLYNLAEVRHGVSTTVKIINHDIIFKGLEPEFKAGLYHSWALSSTDFPSCLEITAVSDEGVIMAIKHKEYNIRGVQFHPESIMTPQGNRMIRNWLKSIKI